MRRELAKAVSWAAIALALCLVVGGWGYGCSNSTDPATGVNLTFEEAAQRAAVDFLSGANKWFGAATPVAFQYAGGRGEVMVYRFGWFESPGQRQARLGTVAADYTPAGHGLTDDQLNLVMRPFGPDCSTWPVIRVLDGWTWDCGFAWGCPVWRYVDTCPETGADD